MAKNQVIFKSGKEDAPGFPGGVMLKKGRDGYWRVGSAFKTDIDYKTLKHTGKFRWMFADNRGGGVKTVGTDRRKALQAFKGEIQRYHPNPKVRNRFYTYKVNKDRSGGGAPTMGGGGTM